MKKRVLVLHGPNLNLLGGKNGHRGHETLAQLDKLLRARALGLGLELRTFQSNHEGALLDRLHAERDWLDGVLVSPSSLSRTGHGLAEALQLIDRPAVEVHLGTSGERSVVADACVAQVAGLGTQGYVAGLERLADALGTEADAASPAAPESGRKKSIGSKRAARAAVGTARRKKTIGPGKQHLHVRPLPPSKAKTVGRSAPSPQPMDSRRRLAHKKVTDLLAGKSRAADVASWARSHWLELEAEEPGDPLLEGVLERLIAASALDAQALVELLARLDGGE